MDLMIRPNIDDSAALELARRLWGVRSRNMTRLNGYDDKNFWLQDCEINGNPNIESAHKDGYVLKVMNSSDSKNTEIVAGQNVLLLNLAKNGVECPQPQQTIKGTLFSMERLETNGPLHAVRLLNFVPGEILDRVPWNPKFALQAGMQLAKISQILQSSEAAALEKRSIPWSLWSAAESGLPHIHVVEEEADRTIVKEVLTCFEKQIVLSRESLNLKESLIHGDYNEQNIIVRQSEGEWSLVAVLDMGDTHRAPLLFEVAIAGTYMALKAASDGVKAADEALDNVIQGYTESGGWFPEKEAALFKLCVCARLAQSLVLGLKAHREDPTNEYVLVTQRQGWPLLRRLWSSIGQPRSP